MMALYPEHAGDIPRPIAAKEAALVYPSSKDTNLIASLFRQHAQLGPAAHQDQMS
jgi:hypothetical protein